MKKFIIFAVLTALIATLSGCAENNYQYFDNVYKFDRAEIKMPDNTVVSGMVESWRDYEDGDQLQVTIDGVTYLTAAENVVLIMEQEDDPE